MLTRRDCNAVETIPLRLMIVAIVASLSILPAAEALDTLRNRDFVKRASLELDEIVSAAQIMAIQGPGNVRTITVDLRGDGTLRFDHLSIGDTQGGPNMSSTVLRFENGASLVRSADEPPVWIRSASGDALQITSSRFTLRLNSVFENHTLSVVAEAM